MSATHKVLLLAAVALLLAGCSAPSSPVPVPTVTVTHHPVEVPTPGPAVTEVPAAEDEQTESGLIFEALGDGQASVTWSSAGTVVQKDVTLPFRVELTAGSYTAGVVQRMSGAVGCRLTLNGTVVDEKTVQEGQLYAECVAKD